MYLQKTDTIPHSATQSFGNTANGFQMQAYTDKMGTYILQEKDMNDRKRLYNREVGRKAIVNEVSGNVTRARVRLPHKHLFLIIFQGDIWHCGDSQEAAAVSTQSNTHANSGSRWNAQGAGRKNHSTQNRERQEVAR